MLVLKRCLILFLSLAGIPMPSCAQNADINLLHNINSNGSIFLDNTCRGLSKSVTPVLIAEPLGVFMYGLVKKDSVLKGSSYVICASLLAAGIISTGLKYTVNRERPFATYSFITKKIEAGSPSFPSGHTSGAFSVATSLSLAFPRWYVIAPSFLWAAGVGYARMELGVHYPTDVLAGAVIGAGFSWLMWKANKWLASRK
jgi:membrane-associated phospholipid phosphatase